MNPVGRSAFFVTVSLLATACGKKGPLIYPDMMIPAAPAAAIAQQSGSIVKLQFTLPDKDRAGRPVQGVAGVRISRRAHEAGQKDVCRSCMTDYTLFQTLYLDHVPDTTQRFGNRLVVLDGDVTAGNSYSYRLVPFTTDGLDGAVSTTADVGVMSALPAPVVIIESLPTEIRLRMSFQLPVAGQLLGYSLYRRVAGTVRSSLPVNKEPQKGGEYVDAGIERGVKYQYSVRALVALGGGDVVESLESQEVEGMLKDDE